MNKYNAYSMKALVALLLLSLVAPMSGLAQQATPLAETPAQTEVVVESDPSDEEIAETPTSKATMEPSTPTARSGERMSPLTENGPAITADAPIMYLNGSSESIRVPIQTVVPATSSSGSEWSYFRSADCSGIPQNGWSTGPLGIQTFMETTLSFRARVQVAPHIMSDCLAVTWTNDPPTLTVYGSTDPVSVPVNSVVKPDAPAGTQINAFSEADCSGNPTFSWGASMTFHGFSSQTHYLQARWGEDDSTRGNCVAVTWEPLSEPVYTSKVCGDNNDAITSPKAQHGISVADTGWVNNERSIALSAIDGYIFPDNQKTVFSFTDEGPCETDAPIAPVQADVCGTNNDVINFAANQPENVVINQSESWSDNHTWTVTFSAAEGYVLPDGTTTEYTFTDSGPCETDAPIPPVHTEVCGSNNDVINFAGNQPENVVVSQSNAWSDDHTWTVTFSAAEGYVLPDGTTTEYIFTDLGPCETDAPVPPVQTEVCGTNNDAIETPIQRENIIVTQSELWSDDSTWTVTFSAAEGYVLPDGTTTEYIFTDLGPCETGLPIPPVQAGVCGTDNDAIETPVQPENIIVTQSESWSDESTWTVTFSAAEGYVLPDGTTTEYVFTDLGPCETEAPIPPMQADVCGTNNDVIGFAANQPENVVVSQSEVWDDDNTWTVTFSAAEHHVLPDGTETEYIFTDKGPCETADPIPPVQSEVCGTNNDIISFPSNQPANVLMAQSDAWSADNTWAVTFSAAEHHALPDGVTTEYIFTDKGPCETADPIPPVQSEVCGTNNDIIGFPSNQPANVLMAQSDAWSAENTWTVTFSAAEHYKLPVRTQTEHVFTDTATPCPTDAPAPPVQSAICGPNNDLIIIPDQQPDGVALETDTGWKNNSRTITFAIAPEFQTQGPTAFTFTDAAEPCPIPTTQVTVQFQTSDGGSLVGSPWQLYAPVAAQFPTINPYLEGTVGPGNEFVLEDMIAGQYRLVVAASGYEVTDETFTVTESSESQTISFQVTAVQPPSPTAPQEPSPTADATETPAPPATAQATETPAPPATEQATADPTSAPTEAVVSGLPNTGSGNHVPGVAYLISLILIVAGVGAITRRPVRQ